jgi:hypothetical protein
VSDWDIELAGGILQGAYQVYVLQFLYDGKEWFYVGQTGDRHALSARSGFHRLAGHLGTQRSSTDNQIYQFIKEKLGPPGEILPRSRVIMKGYHLAHFPLTEGGRHHQVRKDSEVLESFMVQALRQAGKQIINKKLHPPTVNCPLPDILQRMKDDFGLS